MAVDNFFATLGRFYEEPALEFMDAAVTSGIGWASGVVRSALVLSIAVLAYLVMTNAITMRAFATWLVRAIVVTALITNADLFNRYVRDMFFTTIPNDIASALNGGSTRLTVTQQFDAVWSATLNAIGTVLGQATGWSNIGTRIEIAIVKMLAFFALMIAYVICAVARVLAAVVICFGPFLIIGYLFSYTRRFVDSWLSAMITLVLVQLGTSIFLRALMAGNALFLREVVAGLNGGVEVQVTQLGMLAGWFWVGVLVLFGVLWASFRIGSTYAPEVISGAPAAAIAGAAAAGRGAYAGAMAAARHANPWNRAR